MTEFLSINMLFVLCNGRNKQHYDVGRYLVIYRNHDVIQPTEIQRENNKGFTNSVQFRSNIFYQNRDNSTRNKLNQNLVFPITSFSCWVLRDYCGTIRSTLLSAGSHLFSCLPLDIIDNTAEHERVLVADEDQERLLTIAATCLSQQNELKLVDVVNVEWGKSQI